MEVLYNVIYDISLVERALLIHSIHAYFSSESYFHLGILKLHYRKSILNELCLLLVEDPFVHVCIFLLSLLMDYLFEIEC